MLQSQSSVDSSPSFYLFTSATVWIPFHKAPKRGSEHSTLLIVVAQLSSVTEMRYRSGPIWSILQSVEDILLYRWW